MVMLKMFKKKQVEEPKKIERLLVSHTVYPQGHKQMSLNGRDEWYGQQEVSSYRSFNLSVQ